MDSLALEMLTPQAITQPPRSARWASLKSSRNGAPEAYLS
jgi:hypothetical protein